MDLHVAPEELSRAISLADECARTLALIDIEPGTADALGAPDLTSAAAAYATTAGAVVLLIGAVVSVAAYRLMLRLGRLPEEERTLR